MVDTNKNLNWSRLDVLIVDDDSYMCALLKTALRELGVGHVVTAENGDAALTKKEWQSRPFDIVLCDLEMPDMDGFEFVRHMRDDPMRSHVPILIVSGRDDEDSVLKSANRGINGYLLKPVSKVELERRIRNALKSQTVILEGAGGNEEKLPLR